MILVDTSVWIPYLTHGGGEKSALIDTAIQHGEKLAATPQILQEILQGARSNDHFRGLLEEMSNLAVLRNLNEDESYIQAARIYAQCRWKGITPRNSVDCLIAQIAVEHGVPLLHDDRDFLQIAKLLPSLRFV